MSDTVGNDGLTDSERQEYADKYQREAMTFTEADSMTAEERDAARRRVREALDRQLAKWAGVNRRLADR